MSQAISECIINHVHVVHSTDLLSFYSINSWPSVGRSSQRAHSPGLDRTSHQEYRIMFGILLINPEQHFNYENLQLKKDKGLILYEV
jgi:hypothetical protein